MNENLVTVPTGEAKRLLDSLLTDPAAEVPATMLWGQPGIGKSAIVHQLANERGLPVRDVRTAYQNPVDVAGAPVPNPSTRLTEWFPSSLWPRAERDGPAGILFLDEITNAPKLVQGALYELILDRRISEYRLPEGWYVIAAGNRVEDRSAANQMPAALANRMLHILVKPSIADWRRWAFGAGIRHEIIAFLTWKPALLMQPPPLDGCPAFPTPRSWERASWLWSRAPRGDFDTLYQLLGMAVGLAAAAEVVAFARASADLPDPQAILRGEKTARVPREPDRLYFLIVGLVAALSENPNVDYVQNFFTFVTGRLSPEIQVFALNEAAGQPQIRQILVRNRDFVAWAKEHREELAEILAVG